MNHFPLSASYAFFFLWTCPGDNAEFVVLRLSSLGMSAEILSLNLGKANQLIAALNGQEFNFDLDWVDLRVMRSENSEFFVNWTCLGHDVIGSRYDMIWPPQCPGGVLGSDGRMRVSDLVLGAIANCIRPGWDVSCRNSATDTITYMFLMFCWCIFLNLSGGFKFGVDQPLKTNIPLLPPCKTPRNAKNANAVKSR